MKVEWWDRDLESKPGTPSRLGGILVFYEFEWLDEFSDQRAQFKNGKALARLVKRDAPEGKTPALLLSVRDEVDERSFEAENYFVAVVNLTRIRKARGDPAVTYYAERLGPGITGATSLHALAEHPDMISAVVERLAANEEGLAQLRTISGVADTPSGGVDLAQVLAALRALEGLDSEVVKGIEALAGGGEEARRRYLQALTKPVLEDEEALVTFVRENRELLATITRSDVEALDIIALAHRRAVVEEFDRLLHDEDYFSSQSKKLKGPENVWQKFIEDDPWVIGFTLAPQFLHAWSKNRLEQTVKGFSIAGAGKRADAVLRTAGALSALALTEIKHHQTDLLGPEYRPGCWRISNEVAGGVAQCQATADEMSREIGGLVDLKDAEGYIVERAFVCRPRTVLIAGSLTEFVDDKDNIHQEKFESFERFRRGVRDPEILTFDELHARASLLVELADDVEDD